MRVVFAGTPVFAAKSLEAIAQAGHTVVAVLTQPDRPAGRGMKLQASPVKQLALSLNVPVLQPERLRTGPVADATLRFLDNPDGQGRPDVMVVAAYGLILPARVLTLPTHGCLNIHASLLPRWRGAAPIHRAIAAGDTETGITIMQMDEGLDTGAMCRMSRLTIGDDTTGRLHDRLAELGARDIVAALSDLQAGVLRATPQPADGVTYAAKINREEARINWQASAWSIRHAVAAFDPQPGAFSSLPDGKGDLKLFEATVLQAQAGPMGQGPRRAPQPGEVLSLDASGLTVACIDGAVRFASAQRPGGRRLPAVQALDSLKWLIGQCLGLADPSVPSNTQSAP